jgi:hypothetical protein
MMHFCRHVYRWNLREGVVKVSNAIRLTLDFHLVVACGVHMVYSAGLGFRVAVLERVKLEVQMELGQGHFDFEVS